MPIVRLGNQASLDKDRWGRPLEGNRVTTITILDEDSTETRLRTILHDDGLWPRVSAAPAAWVASDDAELESALAEHFNCPIGEPADWS